MISWPLLCAAICLAVRASVVTPDISDDTSPSPTDFFVEDSGKLLISFVQAENLHKLALQQLRMSPETDFLDGYHSEALILTALFGVEQALSPYLASATQLFGSPQKVFEQLIQRPSETGIDHHQRILNTVTQFWKDTLQIELVYWATHEMFNDLEMVRQLDKSVISIAPTYIEWLRLLPDIFPHLIGTSLPSAEGMELLSHLRLAFSRSDEGSHLSSEIGKILRERISLSARKSRVADGLRDYWEEATIRWRYSTPTPTAPTLVESTPSPTITGLLKPTAIKKYDTLLNIGSESLTLAPSQLNLPNMSLLRLRSSHNERSSAFKRLSDDVDNEAGPKRQVTDKKG